MKILKKKKLIPVFLVAILVVMAPLSMAVKNTDVDKTTKRVQVQQDIDKTNGVQGSGKVLSETVTNPLTAVVTILDNFNRPNGPIGPAWTVQNGGFQVFNNEAMGTVSTGLNLVTYNGVNSNTVEADVKSKGSLEYVGLVLGYKDLSNNLFLKVQDQDSILGFDHAACYVGNNGIGFGLGFFTLSSPFTTAHMRAELVSGSVKITFTNIDGNPSSSQSYTCNGAPITGGSGIGMNSYTTISTLDNFAAEMPAPLQMVFAKGSDSALWYRTYDGVNWGPWTSLGGILSSDPEAGTWFNKVIVFVKGTDSALWYRTYDGTAWSPWTSLGGIVTSGAGAS